MTTNRGSILVVEDDRASLQLLELVLSREGYSVRPADNGELALASVAANPPDLILLDIQMPVMDGFEVITRLKAREETRNIPVIFISASSDTAKRTAGFEMGAVDFISKPFHNKELLARVHTHLELSRLRIQLEQQAHDLTLTNSQLENDITEIKRMEEEVRQSGAKYSSLVEKSNDGIVIIENGILQFINTKMTEMVGFARDEVLGRKFVDFSPPEERAALMERHLKRMSGENVPAIYETAIVARDGHHIPVEINSSIIVHQGRPAVMAIIRDITERKQAEEALKKREEYNTVFLDKSPNPIVAVNPDTSISYVNPAFEKSTGYSASEVTGKKPPFPWWVKEDRECPERIFKVSRTDSRYRWERHMRKKSGEDFWVELNAVPVIINGEFKFHLSNWVDITERKRAEREIASLAKFPAENPSPVLRVNRQGTIIYANKGALPLLYEWKTDVGKVLPQIYHNAILNAIDSGSVGRLEAKAGDQIFLLIIAPITEADYVNLYGVDITERKQAEQALRESEGFRSSLLENAPNSVMVTNPDLIITYVNPAVEKLTGYSKSELIGRGLPYPFWHVKDYEAYTQAITWNSRNGIFKLERLFYKKNGEPFWVETNSMPVKDGEQLKYIIFNWIDITERKKAEEELKESEERYRTLFEKAAEGILITDIETRKFIYANPAICKMLGYSQEELTKMSIMDIPPEDSLEHVNAEFDAQARGDKVTALGIPCLKKDGIITYADISSTKFNIDGRDCNVGFFTDATERKQAEAKTIELEALKIVDQAKSDLLANVSHELRTPLTSIKGNIETLLETDIKWSKKQQMDLLQSANEQADHLTLLIKNLLDMSRLDSGKLTLDKRSCQVSEILDSASGALSVITAKHKLKILQVPDLPPVEVDKVRIGQVITNLVENAAKFSPEGSQIEIETKLNEGNVIISVEDHGIGMPPEVVAKLFDRFYQSYQVVEGKTHGTGLGLSICKGIVETHGGKIWVESQEGKGSKFSFSIPLS